MVEHIRYVYDNILFEHRVLTSGAMLIHIVCHVSVVLGMYRRNRLTGVLGEVRLCPSCRLCPGIVNYPVQD